MTDMGPIAICAIFRDEAPFLLEWIAYHRTVGVDHFVLYDNNSADGGSALVRGSHFADRVTLIDWADDPGQITAYRDFRVRHAHRFDWVAFIDLDEFVLPLATDSLPEVLDSALYAGFSAVQLNWVVFGPSGHGRRPPGLIIENYTRRVEFTHQMNGHVKSIVRCKDLFEIFDNPHVFYTTATQCNTVGKLANLRAIADEPASTPWWLTITLPDRARIGGRSCAAEGRTPTTRIDFTGRRCSTRWHTMPRSRTAGSSDLRQV